ncbi:MAG: GtrA family protein [Lysobacter sp.]
MSHRFLMFLLVSGFAAAANVGARVMFGFWFSYLVSIVLAFFVGLVTAFALNRLVVFRDRTGEFHHQAAWFVVVNLFALVQTAAISLVLARWVLPPLGLPHVETWAHMVGVAAPAVTSYIAHNRLTFRRSPAAVEASTAAHTSDEGAPDPRDEAQFAATVVDALENAAPEEADQDQVSREIDQIQTARREVASAFIRGTGVEVGAGSRPFPIPDGVTCFYGDVRDKADLENYFGTSEVSFHDHIDAQTMAGISLGTLDFVISAHVIEHLFDPLGSLAASMATLKTGGVMLLVIPDMTKTGDCRRPPTTLEHIIADSKDGGEGSRMHAYLEHTRYVHPQITGIEIPEDLVEADARAIMAAGMDIHVHAWRPDDAREMLEYASVITGFAIVASRSVFNENIFVLRKD